jgi:hypothetical protein
MCVYDRDPYVSFTNDVEGNYFVQRGDLAFDAKGNAIVAQTQLQYMMFARMKRGIVRPNDDCGKPGNEPLRRMNVVQTTAIKVTPDFTLTSQSTAQVNPIDPCKVGPFGAFDVTSKIRDVIQGVLNRQAEGVDRGLQQVKLRPIVETAWTRANEPFPLSKNAWLVLSPERVVSNQLTFENSGNGQIWLETGLAITARPSIKIGREPAVQAQPLPKLEVGPVGDLFYLFVPVDVDYAEIEKAIKESMQIGKEGLLYIDEDTKRKLRVTAVTMWGNGQTLWLKVAMHGRLSGFVYLYGRPNVDAVTGLLTVPDLEFDVDTKQLLVKAAVWLNHDRFRDFIRNLFRVQLKPQLERTKLQLADALNQTYENVQLSGQVDTLRVLGIESYPEPTKSYVRVYLDTSGRLALRAL